MSIIIQVYFPDDLDAVLGRTETDRVGHWSYAEDAHHPLALLSFATETVGAFFILF